MVHVGIVHFINVVAGQDQQKVRLVLIQQEQVLIDRVGHALVPILADALLRRDRRNVFAEFRIQDIPAAPDMAVQ